MKIQLDYDSKTITLEADCELKEFITVIQRILPDWQKWTLKMAVITNWVNPIPYPYYLDRIETGKPIWDDHTTICGGTTTYNENIPSTLTNGIVNINVN